VPEQDGADEAARDSGAASPTFRKNSGRRTIRKSRKKRIGTSASQAAALSASRSAISGRV